MFDLFKTSSGRIYEAHPDMSKEIHVFFKSGSLGTVDLTPSEFGVLKSMVKPPCFTDNVRTRFDAMIKSPKTSLNSGSKQKLINLYNSRI